MWQHRNHVHTHTPLFLTKEDSPQSSGIRACHVPTPLKEIPTCERKVELEQSPVLWKATTATMISILQESWDRIFVFPFLLLPSVSQLSFLAFYLLFSQICPNWLLQRSSVKEQFSFHLVGLSSSTVCHGAGAYDVQLKASFTSGIRNSLQKSISHKF